MNDFKNTNFDFLKKILENCQQPIVSKIQKTNENKSCPFFSIMSKELAF
jgi:hypothetical protein